MKQKNSSRNIWASALVIIMLIVIPTAAQLNTATPFTAGPVNPKNGGALWIQDSNGLTLQLCDPLNPLCFADPVDLTNPYSVRVGFGPEAFWWLAEASIKDRNNKFSALVVMAAEFAWNTEDPAPGDQFTFTRLRFRIDPIADGTYTVKHPYGANTFEGKKGERIFVTFDIPFTAPGKSKDNKVGPFLTWDTIGLAPPDGPPVGFIGDLDIPHKVTGSPAGTNYFEVTAVKPDGTPIDLDSAKAGVQGAFTDQFAVMGQIATRRGVHVNRADYDLDPLDPGIAVFASTLASIPQETLQISGDGLTATSMLPGPDPLSGIWRRYFGFIAGSVHPLSVIVTNTLDLPPEDPSCLTGDSFGPSCESSVVQKLVDRVTITRAYIYRSTGELEITASSTDPSAVLTAFTDDETPLGILEGGVLVLTGVTVPPDKVVVTSSLGGMDTELIDVGFCETAGGSGVCKK